MIISFYLTVCFRLFIFLFFVCELSASDGGLVLIEHHIPRNVRANGMMPAQCPKPVKYKISAVQIHEQYRYKCQNIDVEEA